MAKKSKIVKNDQRRAVVARYAQRRAELKEIIRSPSSTGRTAGGGATRVRRANPATPARCACATATRSTARPRGHLRKFGLSRVRVRQLAHDGQLPGVRKASW